MTTKSKTAKTKAAAEAVKTTKKVDVKKAKNDITEIVKTFDDACKELNLNPNNLPMVSNLPLEYGNYIIAHFKLIIIAEALNQGWKPNFGNWDEYKYFPWIYKERNAPDSAGFRFGGADFGWTDAYATGGSRLVFKTRALAEYFGKQFIDLINEAQKF